MKSYEAKREYNREYKRKRRLDPKFKAADLRRNMLTWRRKNNSDAKLLDRSRRNETFQHLRNSGISCTKIAAILGVHVNTVLRNTRATPEDKG